MMKNLPLITVKGIQRRFVNGIGYGIDGETCRIGDIQRATSDKPVSYSNIAIKLLLGSYKLKKATADVDGKVSTFENVWMASTMKGRFYGGGMMVAPAQDRFKEDGTVSVVTLYKKNRLVTLMRFPSLNKGEHVLKKFRLTVHIHDAVYELVANNNETLITALERAGIPAVVRCRNGSCGFCHSRVVHGNYYIAKKDDFRRLADRKFNYIHPCSTYPESDMIIDIPIMNP